MRTVTSLDRNFSNQSAHRSDLLLKRRGILVNELDRYLKQLYYEKGKHINQLDARKLVDFFDELLSLSEHNYLKCIEIDVIGKNSDKEILGTYMGTFKLNELYEGSFFKRDQEVKKMGGVDARTEALLRLQKSKAKVMKSFQRSLNNINKDQIMSMEEVRKMLAEKLKGESLSEEIIQERNEARV